MKEENSIVSKFQKHHDQIHPSLVGPTINEEESEGARLIKDIKSKSTMTLKQLDKHIKTKATFSHATSENNIIESKKVSNIEEDYQARINHS